MNRRGFFSALAAVAATAALDPEQALWRPGKLISIPKRIVTPDELFHVGDIITFAGHYDPATGELRKYIVMDAGANWAVADKPMPLGRVLLVMPQLREPTRFHRETFSLTYPSIPSKT